MLYCAAAASALANVLNPQILKYFQLLNFSSSKAVCTSTLQLTTNKSLKTLQPIPSHSIYGMFWKHFACWGKWNVIIVNIVKRNVMALNIALYLQMGCLAFLLIDFSVQFQQDLYTGHLVHVSCLINH